MKEKCDDGEEHDMIECPNCNCEFCQSCDGFVEERNEVTKI